MEQTWDPNNHQQNMTNTSHMSPTNKHKSIIETLFHMKNAWKATSETDSTQSLYLFNI